MFRNEVFGMRVPFSGTTLQVLLAAVDFTTLGRLGFLTVPSAEFAVAFDENLYRRAAGSVAACKPICLARFHRKEVTVIKNPRCADDLVRQAHFQKARLISDDKLDCRGERIPALGGTLSLFKCAVR